MTLAPKYTVVLPYHYYIYSVMSLGHLVSGIIYTASTNFTLYAPPPTEYLMCVCVCVCVCVYMHAYINRVYRSTGLRVWIRGSYLTCLLENGTNLCKIQWTIQCTGIEAKFKAQQKSVFMLTHNTSTSKEKA